MAYQGGPLTQFAARMKEIKEAGVQPLPDDNGFLILAFLVWAGSLLWLTYGD